MNWLVGTKLGTVGEVRQVCQTDCQVLVECAEEAAAATGAEAPGGTWWHPDLLWESDLVVDFAIPWTCPGPVNTGQVGKQVVEVDAEAASMVGWTGPRWVEKASPKVVNLGEAV